MKKTIYICLMTLFFSLSVFAGSFNEYDPANGSYGSPINNTGAGTAGGTFWDNNVTREIARITAMGSNGYLDMREPPTKDYYVGSGGQKDGYGWKTAKSILEYQFKAGDVVQIFDLYENILYDSNGEVLSAVLKLDANGNIQHGFIITNNGSTFQQTPPVYTLQQANTAMMNTFVSEPTRPYFSYNVYNVNNNSVTEGIYKPTPNGPELVRSTELRPYSNIPRVVKENVTFAPGSPFMIGASIYNSTATQLSLFDGYRIIRDYLDYASPDNVIAQFNDGLGLREREILNKVIPKIREGLPAELKPDAESVLAMYLQQCDANPSIHPALIMNNLLNLYSQAKTKYPTMTGEQFENWFMGESEGIDGDYDAAYWENPNLIFPQQSLPSFSDFKNAYPKNSNGTFEMNYADVYTLVGGTPKALRDAVLTDSDPSNDRNYDNACALRTSRALNYSRIVIPYIKGQTFKGSDDMYYFLGARNLYQWMLKTFPPNPQNSIVLKESDGGTNGVNFRNSLGSNQGIYILIPKNQSTSGFGASGHAGIYTSPELTHYYFGATGGVESITLWKLN